MQCRNYLFPSGNLFRSVRTILVMFSVDKQTGAQGLTWDWKAVPSPPPKAFPFRRLSLRLLLLRKRGESHLLRQRFPQAVRHTRPAPPLLHPNELGEFLMLRKLLFAVVLPLAAPGMAQPTTST